MRKCSTKVMIPFIGDCTRVCDRTSDPGSIIQCHRRCRRHRHRRRHRHHMLEILFIGQFPVITQIAYGSPLIMIAC